MYIIYVLFNLTHFSQTNAEHFLDSAKSIEHAALSGIVQFVPCEMG